MPSLSLSSNTITSVTGVDYTPGAARKKITRDSQDACWFYHVRAYNKSDSPWNMKTAWSVVSMPFPPVENGLKGDASSLYVTNGWSWARREIIDWNTVCSVNVHDTQTFSFSSFTGNQGLGTCGVIFSDGPGLAQREYEPGDVASSVQVVWDDGQLVSQLDPNVINWDLQAIQWAKFFVEQSNGYLHQAGQGQPKHWITHYPQSFDLSGAHGDPWTEIVVQHDVPGNGLWRDDLVQ